MHWSHFERLEGQIHRMTERLAALEEEAETLRADNARLTAAAQIDQSAVQSLKKANATLTDRVEHASQNGELNQEIQVCLTHVLQKLNELQLTL